MKKIVLPIVILLSLALGLSLAAKPAEPQGSISIVGSTSVQPIAEELAKAFMTKYPKVSITVAGGGSSAGTKAAMTGAADLGASSRELKPEEAAAITPTVIAKDGIAIIINKNNRVSNLTIEQVYKIYTGKVTNWKDVGGVAAPIILIGRDSASGTRGAFEELVYHKFDPKAVSDAGMMQQASTGTVRQMVSVTKYAIGYISMGSLYNTVKSVKVEGVAPSVDNVLNSTYKISRPFILASRGAPQGLVKSFLDFVLSPAGQAIVAKEFVPVGKTK